MSFTEHLLRARSEDGLRLDGIGVLPEGEFLPIGIVWVHDLYGAFYQPPYADLSRVMARRGYLSVVGNLRGHDFGSILPDRTGRPIVGGGAWERFHESPYDIAAWIGAATRLGVDEVVLVGHGLGARKGVFYQIERHDPRVLGVAICSAGLNYPPVDRESLEQAEEMLSRGKGRDLLPWPPVGASMSAQTFVDVEMTYRNVLYEHNGRESAVSRVRVPLLAMYGGAEDLPGRISGNLDIIARNAFNSPVISTAIIPDANHLYEGCEEVVGDVLTEWLESL